MILRPPRSTQSRSSAASDVYKRQVLTPASTLRGRVLDVLKSEGFIRGYSEQKSDAGHLSLIHISEPTRPY